MYIYRNMRLLPRHPSITTPVVISRPFIKKLLHNHFITEFFLKKESGEAKDSAIFALLLYFISFIGIYYPLTFSLIPLAP
jgi:hypothetical protein